MKLCETGGDASLFQVTNEQAAEVMFQIRYVDKDNQWPECNPLKQFTPFGKNKLLHLNNF